MSHMPDAIDGADVPPERWIGGKAPSCSGWDDDPPRGDDRLYPREELLRSLPVRWLSPAELDGYRRPACPVR
jgi:hypothetical protein